MLTCRACWVDAQLTRWEDVSLDVPVSDCSFIENTRSHSSRHIECFSCEQSSSQSEPPPPLGHESEPRTETSIRQLIASGVKFGSHRYLATMVKPAGLLSNRYKIEDMPDLSGKVAVVTGGSRGIGEATVTALVQKGCEGESIPTIAQTKKTRVRV